MIQIQIGVDKSYVDDANQVQDGVISTNTTTLNQLKNQFNTDKSSIMGELNKRPTTEAMQAAISGISTGLTMDDLNKEFEKQLADYTTATQLRTEVESVVSTKMGNYISDSDLATKVKAALDNNDNLPDNIKQALLRQQENEQAILNAAAQGNQALVDLNAFKNGDWKSLKDRVQGVEQNLSQAVAGEGVDLSGYVTVQGLEDSVQDRVSIEVTNRKLATIQEVTDATGSVTTSVQGWINTAKNDAIQGARSGMATSSDITSLTNKINEVNSGIDGKIDNKIAQWEQNLDIATNASIQDQIREGVGQATDSIVQEVGDMIAGVMENTADMIDLDGLAIPTEQSESSGDTSFDALVDKLQEKPVRRSDVLKKVINEDAYYWYVMPVIDQRIYRDTVVEGVTVEYGWQKAVKERYWYHKGDNDIRDHYIYLFRSDVNSIEMKANPTTSVLSGRRYVIGNTGLPRMLKDRDEIPSNMVILGGAQGNSPTQRKLTNTVTLRKPANPVNIDVPITDAMKAKSGRTVPSDLQVGGSRLTITTKLTGNDAKPALNAVGNLPTYGVQGRIIKWPKASTTTEYDKLVAQGNYPSDFYYIGCYAECDDSSMYRNWMYTTLDIVNALRHEDTPGALPSHVGETSMERLRKRDDGSWYTEMDGDEVTIPSQYRAMYFEKISGDKHTALCRIDATPTNDELNAFERRPFADVSRDIQVHMLPIYLLGSTGIAIDSDDVDRDGKYNYVTIDSMITPASGNKADIVKENGGNISLEKSSAKAYEYVCKDNVAMMESGYPCVYGQGYTWLPLDAKGDADDETGLGVHCDYIQDAMWVASGVYAAYNGLIPSGYTKSSLKQMTTMYRYKILEKFAVKSDDGDYKFTPIFMQDYSDDGIADLNETLYDINIMDNLITYTIKDTYLVRNEGNGGVTHSKHIEDTLAYITQNGAVNTNNIFLVCVEDDGDEYIFDEYIYEAGKVLKLNEQKRIKYSSDLRKLEYVMTNIGVNSNGQIYTQPVKNVNNINRELITREQIEDYLFEDQPDGNPQTIKNPNYIAGQVGYNIISFENFKTLWGDRYDGYVSGIKARGDITFIPSFYSLILDRTITPEPFCNFNIGELLPVVDMFRTGDREAMGMPGIIMMVTMMSWLCGAIAASNTPKLVDEHGGTYPLITMIDKLMNETGLPAVDQAYEMCVKGEKFEPRFGMDMNVLMNAIKNFRDIIPDKVGELFDESLGGNTGMTRGLLNLFKTDDSFRPKFNKNINKEFNDHIKNREYPVYGDELKYGYVGEGKGIRLFIFNGGDNPITGMYCDDKNEVVFMSENEVTKSGITKNDMTISKTITYTDRDGLLSIGDKSMSDIPRILISAFLQASRVVRFIDLTEGFLPWYLTLMIMGHEELANRVVDLVERLTKESGDRPTKADPNPNYYMPTMKYWPDVLIGFGDNMMPATHLVQPYIRGNNEPKSLTIQKYKKVARGINKDISSANNMRRYNKVLAFLRSVDAYGYDGDLVSDTIVTADFNFELYRWSPSAQTYMYIGPKTESVVNTWGKITVPDLNKVFSTQNQANDDASRNAENTNNRFRPVEEFMGRFEKSDFEAWLLEKMPTLKGLLESPDFQIVDGKTRVREPETLIKLRNESISTANATSTTLEALSKDISGKLDMLANAANQNKGIEIVQGKWSLGAKSGSTTISTQGAEIKITAPTNVEVKAAETITIPAVAKVKLDTSKENISLVTRRF